MTERMIEEELRITAVHHVVHDYADFVSAGTEIYKHRIPPLNAHVQYSFIVGCRKFGVFFGEKPSKYRPEMFAGDFLGEPVSFNLDLWTVWRGHMNSHFFT